MTSLTIMCPTKSQFQKYLHPTSCLFYVHQYFLLYHIANYISNKKRNEKEILLSPEKLDKVFWASH